MFDCHVFFQKSFWLPQLTEHPVSVTINALEHINHSEQSETQHQLRPDVRHLRDQSKKCCIIQYIDNECRKPVPMWSVRRSSGLLAYIVKEPIPPLLLTQHPLHIWQSSCERLVKSWLKDCVLTDNVPNFHFAKETMGMKASIFIVLTATTTESSASCVLQIQNILIKKKQRGQQLQLLKQKNHPPPPGLTITVFKYPTYWQLEQYTVNSKKTTVQVNKFKLLWWNVFCFFFLKKVTGTRDNTCYTNLKATENQVSDGEEDMQLTTSFKLKGQNYLFSKMSPA